MAKTDVDYKKVLVSEVAPDGGLGTQWKKIDGTVRQGTASFTGSEADITEHKNVHGEVLESSMSTGIYNFNLQCGDITAANRAYFQGGTVVTTAEGINYQAPSQMQAINLSIMVIGKNNSVDYATNVRVDAFPTRSDDDLAYLQVNSTVQKPTKEGVEPYGSWDNIDADANDILTFVLDEQTGSATIDDVAHTVAIEVANGTSVTALIPTIGVSLGANATPNSLEAQDFTSPVVYSVENANGVSQNWTVTVTVAA